MKIYLCDLYHDYKPNHICVPLGVGFVAAYLDQEFGALISTELFKSPSDLSSHLTEGPGPDIVGFSNYSWNVALNKIFKERLKREFPSSVIIEGGPHIRIDREGIKTYLNKNPMVDFYIMLEGEFATKNLVQALIDHKEVDLSLIHI